MHPVLLWSLSALADPAAGTVDNVLVEAVLVEHCGGAGEVRRLAPDQAPVLFEGLGALDGSGRVVFSPMVVTNVGTPAEVHVGRVLPDGGLPPGQAPDRIELTVQVDAGEQPGALSLDLGLVDRIQVLGWELPIAQGEVLVLPASRGTGRCRRGAEARRSLVVVVEPGADKTALGERQAARGRGRAVQGRRRVEALLRAEEATRWLAEPRR
jgi:hypothetical protein